MAGSPSNSVGGWTYDVFLSFRGLNTRKHFLNHLYTALDNAGFYTYKDDQRILTGEPIAGQLSEAIEVSRFAVVVFSKDYADSAWCLEELAHINDCRNKSQLTVCPVFYNVKPSVVRRQLETYGEAFKKHEDRHEYEKIKRWKDALLEIADLSGIDASNGCDESECIKKIVQYISSNCIPLPNCEGNLVGMTSRVQDLKLVLATELDVVRFVGIWGIGGAGKTTLAWDVYNKIKYQFEGGGCFVENVKELSKQYSGLEKLQEKILSEILKGERLKVSSIRDGTALMGSRLRRKKVLLVLDDVDDDAQLDALAAHHEWFGKGSRIIITTRDQQLLKRPTPIEEYNVSLLNEVEAIKLFSLHAFGKDSPPEEYKDGSSRVVRQAGGSPLALKISGCYFTRMEISATSTPSTDSSSEYLVPPPTSIPESSLYDVFLSFRGKDTRKIFTSHLYNRLVEAGIHTFMNDDELCKGGEVSLQLMRAIEESRMYVVVFSQTYASSTWCLNELVKILRQCDRNKGRVLLPVFYGVQPSDVRYQKESFEEAFRFHDANYMDQPYLIETWRNALFRAVDYSGFDWQTSEIGSEASFISLIVKEVLFQVKPKTLYVAKYPVGLDSRVNDVHSLLRLQSDYHVRLIGIWGMGGSGKTIIAKALYNKIHLSFDSSCFLANVKERSRQPDGILHLQEYLISELLMRTNVKVSSVDGGMEMIGERLRRKKVLIVLDDTDKLSQIDALAGHRGWFGPGSRIIITTRDQSLLNQVQVDGIYYSSPELTHLKTR